VYTPSKLKRKTILLAGKTLVVSLPNKWVKEWAVKKGQELELVENGPSITVKTDSEKIDKKATVNISNNTERAIRWILSSLHKKGYDEIEIQYATPQQADIVQELLKDLFMGFAIVQQGEKIITVKTVSKDMKETFDQVLRRTFLITLSLAENTLHALNEGKEATQYLHLEKTNNQLTNFCQRLLNKYGHEDPSHTTFMYVILWNLEKVADDYKYIIKQKPKCCEESLELMERTNKMLRSYYELFYKFDLEKLNEQAEQRKKLEENIMTALRDHPEDAQVLSHLHHTVQKIADFAASTVAVNEGWLPYRNL